MRKFKINLIKITIAVKIKSSKNKKSHKPLLKNRVNLMKMKKNKKLQMKILKNYNKHKLKIPNQRLEIN